MNLGLVANTKTVGVEFMSRYRWDSAFVYANASGKYRYGVGSEYAAFAGFGFEF